MGSNRDEFSDMFQGGRGVISYQKFMLLVFLYIEPIFDYEMMS